MLIPKINSIPNFRGVFQIVHQDGTSDNINAIEINNTKAVYHPYKNETQAEIEQAMKNYKAKSSSEVEKTMNRHWCIANFYTCTLGSKLPYNGKGVVDPDLE